MVDAKPLVSLPGAFAVIPPGKFPGVAVHLPKHVDEAPLLNMMDRCPFGLGEMYLSLPRRDVPDIKFVRRDIKIST